MKRISIYLLILFFTSCEASKKTTTYYRDLDQLLHDNANPIAQTFVILKTGDTIFSDKISKINRIDRSMLSGFNYLYSLRINGKKYFGDEIIALQEKGIFYKLNSENQYYGRIATGKINIYVFYYFSNKENKTTNSWDTGIPRQYFAFDRENETSKEFTVMSYYDLKNAISENKEALETFYKLYPTKKEDLLKDYKNFIEVIKVYNK